MKKETVTQKSLWECPNCGAPRVANESNCRFCGSALVMRTVVTEEMTKESVDRQFIIDNSHPTIVSELKPAWITEPTRLVLLLAAGVFAGIGLWLGYKALTGDSGLLVPMGLAFAIALVFVAVALLAVVKYRRFLKTAPEYEATVVSVDKRKVPIGEETPGMRTRYSEYTTMTALFSLDGKKVFGLFRVSNNITRSTFGKGEKVKIKVKDGNIALWEG